MRLRKLHLKAFGPFTDRVLDFSGTKHGIVLVHGPNEAGKSSALRAISDLRFGIPVQSKDNFVHSHPDMRIGGEFVDRNGKTYSVMRRKGRGTTLFFADFELAEQNTEDPVPLEVEALLTGGLTKESYDSMFGLDHQRLRQGGQALLKGEGDVGAALFEASAGVRSIPDVLERLDASARKFFMPGARGRNALINEALTAYDHHHGEWRQALVRPAQWADLFKKHETAAGDLEELERRRGELNGKLLLIKELRAVAPLLGTLDNADRALQDLKSVTMLTSTAAVERASAESGLAAATENASVAAADVTRQLQKLGIIEVDTAVLAVGPAVKRLAASADSIDQHRRDIADARIDVSSGTHQVAGLASRIAPTSTPEEVLKKAPTETQRAGIEKVLRSVELAKQALDHHLEVGRQSADSHEPIADGIPSSASRTALRIAQAEVARSDSALKRLSALPGEIKASRRAVVSALDAVGLADEAAFRRVRPLLDAHIDAALKEESTNASRRDSIATRVDEIAKALLAALQQRDRLLKQGAVATRDDVQTARSHRDAGWALVRGTYIDCTNPTVGSFGGGAPLTRAYEEAVVNADYLVDELASDTERAAQLQASKDAIVLLQRDSDDLKRQLADIDGAETNRCAAWNATLVEAALPPQSPAALRDWQALLQGARTLVENLQSKLDELEQVQGIETALAGRLRAAISSTGLAMPAQEEALSTLSATAAELDATIRQRETAVTMAAGQQSERERQRQQRVARESQLTATLDTADRAAQSILSGLLLPEESDVAIARARIAEFEDFAEAQDRLTAATTKQKRAEEALAVLTASATAIRESLEDPEPTDLRLYSEHLSARLETAEAAQTARTLAQQAADSARESLRAHEATATRHENVIAALCLTAAVASVNQLPEAENNSLRKREAQADLDRSRSQLALASRRTVDELRALLADQDVAQMDADEASYTHEQLQVDANLRVAREVEERTRRDLEAIDGSDIAVTARDGMERAASSVRTNMPPWIRSKIAFALLSEALRRFRDRAQGPMLKAASEYFERMTRGEFVRLHSDDLGKEPVLIAQRNSGSRIRVEEMSEGTLDQLYLALRLAALDVRRAAGVDLPLILDDVLMTSDEDRSGAILAALADFARGNQVLVFTHHRHIADVAGQCVSPETLTLVPL
jgi:exonuclease SbcC